MYTSFLPQPIAQYASLPSNEWPPAGTISLDRSAIVGREQWCFIYEGSNNYRYGYIDDNRGNVGEVWARIIERRAKACRALGLDFLQVIVPNKLTIIPEYFTESLSADITSILSKLLESNPCANLVVPIELFRSNDIRHGIFRRNDSHLTVAGNGILADIILRTMGLMNMQTMTVATKGVIHDGDLGSKFLSAAAAESVHVPDFSSGLLGLNGPVKISEVISVGFNGTVQVFRNENAPIKKVLVVFGNSFFERVPSWGLSPFFVSLFKSFHFIWSASIDIAYCMDVLADIVIAQTCERFLPLIPDDKLKGLR